MKRLTLVNVSQGFFQGTIPLGLSSIAGYLKRYAPPMEITLLDSNCQDIYQSFKPTDIVGVGAVTQDIKNAIHFAEFVKSKSGVPVVLGGVHISTYRKLPEPFDVGVIGEGEETMLELMQLPDFSRDNLKQVKGICYNEGGTTVFTEPRPVIAQLDSIPIPDREITNLDYYLIRRQVIPYYFGRTLTMITSRGCPFDCVFCSTKIHWQKFRAFSAERVIEEIELLIGKYNAELIYIFDDLFITDKKRLSKIHKFIVEKEINKKAKFMCLVRSDMIDDVTMTMLKEMNVVITGIGMESGSPDMLKYLKRRTTTIENNHCAIELSNLYNIPTMGSFMLGNPNETENELLETLKFIRSYRYSPFLSPLSYIATAFPGTQFWDYAKAKGINVEDFDNIVMDIPNTPESLKKAPLLTDIPIDIFFPITQLFAKETAYGEVKRCIFLPRNSFSIIRAYLIGIRIERNIIKGIIEVTRIIISFNKYKRSLPRRSSLGAF
ncbi:MAG: B12-binding domain-containing radical SAM protein [Sedimentisphaerales bacterium]